jgi:hypothetical protein
MTRTDRFHTSRRSLFHAILGAGIATTLGRGSRVAQAAPDTERKLLFVVAMAGGASIVDSFLPVSASEAGSKANSLVAYPDQAIGERGGFRYVKKIDGTDPLGKFSSDYDLGTFLDRHGSDTAVVTQEVTSVNHVVAQKRAVTGANVNRGRTLMEAGAAVHGSGLALPNCNFATGGYAEPGSDASVPEFARGEVVSDPLYFPLATDASRGIRGGLPKDLLEHAREVRSAFEARSPFLTRYGKAKMLEAYGARRAAARAIEDADLLSKLMLLPEGEIELSDYDLESSPMLARMVGVFPNLARGDAMEAQAAVGFLLARYGISASVTLGPSFVPSFLDAGKIVDTPLIFDYSHTDHVTAQNVMWRRMMQVVDGLITLLKEEDYLGDGSLGPMWDRSLVYLATDFGRTKDRPAGSVSFGSGHDLSNGNVLVSPLLRGGRVYGGVDPTTVKTYGFDPATGEADPSRLMSEGDVYSLVAQGLGVDFEGRTDMSSVVR